VCCLCTLLVTIQSSEEKQTLHKIVETGTISQVISGLVKYSGTNEMDAVVNMPDSSKYTRRGTVLLFLVAQPTMPAQWASPQYSSHEITRSRKHWCTMVQTSTTLRTAVSPPYQSTSLLDLIVAFGCSGQWDGHLFTMLHRTTC
jgi:hypothetical protein